MAADWVNVMCLSFLPVVVPLKLLGAHGYRLVHLILH